MNDQRLPPTRNNFASRSANIADMTQWSGAAMTFINPLAGSIAQGSQAQRVQQSEKDRQGRHAQNLRRDSGARGEDVFEHVVETSEEVTSIHEERRKESQKRRKPPQKQPENSDTDGGDRPHIDVRG